MVVKMDKRSNKVVLSLGGNLGDVADTLQKALFLVNNRIGELEIVSPVYQTKAWGVKNQPDFLNIAVIIKTVLLPMLVLEECLLIEKDLGRVRNQKWYERTIDIDILFYNNTIINFPELIVPHPYISERNFVLYPLTDILPKFKHPILLKSILDLKKECKDALEVNQTLHKLII